MINLLGQKLVQLRKNKKLTQEDIATYLGITRPAYTAYEIGKRNPDYDTLIKIATFFNVTTDYLLGSNSNNVSELEFEAFANDPELQQWYKELPKSDEEDLRKLRKLWDIIKNNES